MAQITFAAGEATRRSRGKPLAFPRWLCMM
jgi:hypothetical protein